MSGRGGRSAKPKAAGAKPATGKTDKAARAATTATTVKTARQGAAAKAPPAGPIMPPTAPKRSPTLETSNPNSAKPATETVGADVGRLFGEMTWLAFQSPTHKHLFLADLEWLLVPAILAKQFRLYRKKGVPIAYASWAFLSEEAERRLRSGAFRLSPADWRSGERAWLIDLVAPFGGAEGFLRDLKAKVFADRPLNYLRPKADGTGIAADQAGAARPTAPAAAG
ncbi:MAG: toxin-activating lysine-acyltransferase [Rhodospirillales bacterium]|nr:toxin-activating lysine-acyltransferase [Rhodospirillales bacterium]